MGDSDFEEFFVEIEPRLRQALTVRYGSSVGRAAAVDALSYAWEHWSRVSEMANPVGYLYRVGQSASRRHTTQRLPGEALAPDESNDFVRVDPDLAVAVAALPEKQRTAVLLVAGLGHTQRAAAELLDVSPSTVQTHVERGLASLRQTLEVTDVQQ